MRRASRHDLPALLELLASQREGRSERFDRRLLRNLGTDVYVALGDDQRMLGAVSLAFVRSFAAGHWRAELDGLWVCAGAEGLIDQLLVFAVQRAAQRHCLELAVTQPPGAALAAALGRHGYRRGDSYRTAVVPVPAKVPRRGRRRSS